MVSRWFDFIYPQRFKKRKIWLSRSSQSFFVLQNKVLVKQKSTNIYILMLQKLRGKDLNQRPPGYEPDELPDCSTPRYSIKYKCQKETNYLVSLRGVDQIWTGDEGVADLCLTTWLRRHNMTPTGFEPMLPPWKGGVLTTWPRSQTPRVGLEPTTARLTAACSTDWAIEEYWSGSYPENRTHYIISF